MSETKYRQLRRSKAQDIPATIKRIFSYFKKYKIQFTTFSIACILTGFTSIASSYLFSPIIDDYVEPLIGKENPDFGPFIKMIIFIACLYLTGVILSWVWRKMISYVSTGVLNDMRQQLFAKMQDLPVSFYDGHTHGELMNYYTNDIDIIRPLLTDGMPSFIQTSMNLVFVLILMFLTNVKLALLSVASLIVMCLITYKLAKTGSKYFAGVQKGISNINGFVEEMFQGQKVVKVFQHEKKAYEDFMVFNRETYKSAVVSNAMAGMLMPINGNISYVMYALIAVYGAYLVINGEMSVGEITSFLLFSRQIAGPVSNLSQQFNGIMMSIAGAERAFGVLDLEPEVDEGHYVLVNVTTKKDKLIESENITGQYAWKDLNDGSLTLLKGDIRLKDVTFGYVENKTVLKNVSLYAKPGQKIAFVGSTGAGKTTITNLINRFYDVKEGNITYDGIDVKDIKKSALRESLGCVLQDTNLFSGTVLDNIRYGNLEASDEQCIEAAKLANADSFINRLPEGYNTMLTANGANLSQGQRQLLNIARAAVANPPVLILDEATSSVDTHTEKLIEKGMDKLMAGRTVFVIAHRLSTVRNSNAIIVLEHGQIIERGDHEDLLKNKGRYYQLYTGKAELD